MVCGGITSTGRTPLIIIKSNLNTVSYLEEIIQAHIIPFIQCHIMLQQDNTRPHVAWVVRHFLVQQNIDVLSQPAVSPNLSPIKHVWDKMRCRLCALPNQSVTLAVLGQTLVQIQNGTPQILGNNLVTYMRQQCQACIHAIGGHSCY